MGGAPRNPAPRNHLLVWVVKPSGCHCTAAFSEHTYRRVPTPLRSTSPFSELRTSRSGSSHGRRARRQAARRGTEGEDRGNISHTRNRHHRNHRGFSVALSNAFSVTFSITISSFRGTFRRVAPRPVDFHWNWPMDFQWHSPLEFQFCGFWRVIFCPARRRRPSSRACRERPD